MNIAFATLMLLLVILTTWHFFYEAILLPSLRLNVRFKLFALRDELRAIKAEPDTALNDELFGIMNASMNALIDRLPSLTISAVHQSEKAASKDPMIMETVREIRCKIQSCENHRVREIDNECASLFRKVFLLNAGGWTIYLVPIAICFALWKKISQGIQSLTYSTAAFRDTFLPPTVQSHGA